MKARIKEKNNIVMAVDLASRQSGWALFDGDELINFGTVAPAGANAEQRLPSIRQSFQMMLDAYEPGHIILEIPAGGAEDVSTGPDKNWMTMAALFMTHGVLRELLMSSKIPYSLVSPSTWQFSVGIHKRERAARKAGAKQVAMAAYPVLGAGREQDIYDSVCLFLAWKFEEDKNKEGEVSAF